MIPADAFFESMSGITTTGSAVITRLDDLPPGLLLWRSILQWVGGLGVIVLGLFFPAFPEDRRKFGVPAGIIRPLRPPVLAAFNIRDRNRRYLRGLNSALRNTIRDDRNVGFRRSQPRHDHRFDRRLLDARCLLRLFHEPIDQWVAIIFMLIGATPFTALIVLMLKRRVEMFRDDQVIVMLGYVLFLSVIVAVYLDFTHREALGPGLEHSVFNIVSLVTTTGYANADYLQWGPFAAAMVFMATFLGGCSGSTAGGMKTYRWIALYGIIRRAIDRIIYPHSVASVHSGTNTIADETLEVVLLYFTVFILIWSLLSIALTATGADFLTAMSGALTAMANVGPGLGEAIGPTGNFQSLTDVAKWILSFAMLLGRLGVFTVLVLLSPAFWRE
jgi:trk system potassium uptake protein TrkH